MSMITEKDLTCPGCNKIIKKGTKYSRWFPNLPFSTLETLRCLPCAFKQSSCDVLTDEIITDWMDELMDILKNKWSKDIVVKWLKICLDDFSRSGHEQCYCNSYHKKQVQKFRNKVYYKLNKHGMSLR